MREASLPPQWACLEGKVRYVQQENERTYTSTCPECGGEPHDGEWPNRCALFLNPPVLWCRKCHIVRFPDQFGDTTYHRPDEAQMEKWRAEREAEQEAARRKAEKALAFLRSERLWVQYYEHAGETGRALWRGCGIPDSWQDYWQLGYDPAHTFYVHGDEYTAPTLTIPIAVQGGEVQNIKHRLLQLDAAGEKKLKKYRYQIRWPGPAPLYLCDAEKPIAGQVVIAEGEKKIMVVCATLDNPSLVFLGIPGKDVSDITITPLLTPEVERVTIIADPDARMETWTLCQRIGLNKCRVLMPTGKIDDCIMQSKMTGRELRWLLNNAIPAKG
jgi:hypothetical protein